jgi:hypothetical protein
MLNVDRDRKMQTDEQWRSIPAQKNAASETEAAFSLIVTRKEEISLSLAGLAATYSPRA